MRTTVALDDDVYDAAKTLAETTGRSLGAVISDLVRRGLERRAQIRTRNGLPVFDLPAKANIIPGNRAAELLADEGLG